MGISGLVTFIAAYHYVRIFNSWVEAYSYAPGKTEDGAMDAMAPKLTGVPFNDAYRYMDWLLHVGHHLQVWRRPLDLPDFVRQVEQGGSAWLSSSAGRARLAADFSGCGVALTAVGQRDL